ncbi:MAG: type II toxin-antitoxin system YafQ family toxin [Bacteroidetes bacterium]|nr:type II toxin-antitoxin system YafQ family toxin [Bacteroidota bacterium]
MYILKALGSFKKDMKRCQKRNNDMALLQSAMEKLSSTGTLPIFYKPHKLIGNYVHHWEAHIKSDWLIVWFTNEDKKMITLVRTGTHADLF